MHTEKTEENSRRNFLKGAVSAAALGAMGTGFILNACSRDRLDVEEPAFLDKAPDGRLLKAGLIGCGHRGTGAAFNFLNAGTNLEITALGDVFGDRLERCRQQLREHRNVEVADEKCFIGFDAYEKVIDSGVDVVLLAAPPYFRPSHFDAAVRARKHVFMEKNVAVDPVGARAIMASSRMADSIGLKVVTGTQRRHQRDYLTAYEYIKAGAIGDIVSANCYWNQQQLWHVKPQPGWTEMEAMLRNWINWCWLAGDHIVEQHIHNIDVVIWFKNALPTKALSFGSRQRRITGDHYDFFSTDFVFEDGSHLHSMCRQINGCSNNVSEHITGTKGTSDCKSYIRDDNGNMLWQYPYSEQGYDDGGVMTGRVSVSPYDQEIINLITAIRNDTPLNEAETCAKSTLAGIMGRMSAYTGKEVTWEEVMNSNLRLGPEKLTFGDVGIKAIIPVPGIA